MTTVPPEKLPCPKCHFEPVVNVLSIDGQRVGILCAQCFELRAIAVMPPSIKLEISWLLEGGRLSESNQNFLKRIARKKFSELSDKELSKLSRLQHGDRGVSV